MYLVRSTRGYRKAYKQVSKQKDFDGETLGKIIDTLAREEKLDQKYKDHQLTGEMKDSRECHIKHNLLLIYEKMMTSLFCFFSILVRTTMFLIRGGVIHYLHMKTTPRGFIVPILLVIIALVFASGGAYVYTQNKQANPLVSENTSLPMATSTTQTSDQTTSVTQIPDSQIAGWKTYTNTDYGFEVKYPSTWEVQDYKKDSSLPSPDTVGFAPQNLGDFPQCVQDAKNLRENYKQYNPFPGYESYSDTVAKIACAVHFRVELNTTHSSLVEFLSRNFSNDRSLQAAIGELQVMKDSGVQKVVSPRYDFAFDAGISGSGKNIDASGPQYMISTPDFIIFIKGSYIVDNKNYDNILTSIVQSVNIVK